jgi:hypothetical protein
MVTDGGGGLEIGQVPRRSETMLKTGGDSLVRVQ